MLRGMIELSVWERTELGKGRWRSRKINRYAVTFPYGKHGHKILAMKLREEAAKLRKMLKA